jgi:hypothetical protein
MELKENSEEIFIRYVPFWRWSIGAILIFISAFFGIWFLYTVLTNSNVLGDVPFIVFGIAFSLVVIFDISLGSLIFAALVTVSVKRKARCIDINYRRIYGRKTERLFFHQIEKFKSYKTKSGFSTRYFLALVLANGKTVELKIPIGSDKQITTKFIKNLNKFMKSKAVSNEIADGK